MDEKITIIEGPPPVFEAVNDGWALGLNEGSRLSVPALTRLRTFNGPALVERCYRAWNTQSPIHLHYRNDMGMEQAAPILAARNVETPMGMFFCSGYISITIRWSMSSTKGMMNRTKTTSSKKKDRTKVRSFYVTIS